MEIVNVKDEDHLKTITSAKDKLVVIDCTATWCGPCKTFGKFYDKFVSNDVSKDCSNKVTFCKLDIDKLQQFCDNNKISSVPTILFIKNNAVLETIVGCNTTKFKQLFEKHVAKSSSGSSNTNVQQ